MISRIVKAGSLAGVHTHTHTHTHTISLVKVNEKNIIKDNIGLSSKYYNTG